MDSYNLTHTGAELDSAVGRALEGFAAADAATEAAKAAAKLAEDTAAEVQEKLDNGEFIGPIGKSGVYVGSGDMPEGYTVQVDPTGDMLCYTAGESDSRYANVLTSTASGPVAALEDVSPTGALRRAAALGATTETGEGDKGPDNPYTLAGVQPTNVTVCGRNLAANMIVEAAPRYAGTIFCDFEPLPNTTYTISLIVPDGESHYSNENLFTSARAITAESKTLTLTTKAQLSKNDIRQYAAGKGWRLFKNNSTAVSSGNARDLQIEFGDTATPYEPYTGQTITLPALEPLYGDGTVCDEYDAATGVENRRWKRLVFDGTESMRCEAHGNGQRYVSIDLDAAANKSVMPISTHYTSSAWTQDNNKMYIPNPVVMVITDSRFTTLQAARDILAAQYAAGTPVTVVYQLDAPAVTQHDPARILPPAPVCRVFADAGNAEVGYNRDVNIVIPKLEAALAELLGGGAQPMT